MTFSVTGVVVHTVPDHASHVPSEFFHVAVSPVYSSLLSIPQVVSSSTDPSLCTLLSPPPVLISQRRVFEGITAFNRPSYRHTFQPAFILSAVGYRVLISPSINRVHSKKSRVGRYAPLCRSRGNQ